MEPERPRGAGTNTGPPSQLYPLRRQTNRNRGDQAASGRGRLLGLGVEGPRSDVAVTSTADAALLGDDQVALSTRVLIPPMSLPDAAHAPLGATSDGARPPVTRSTYTPAREFAGRGCAKLVPRLAGALPAVVLCGVEPDDEAITLSAVTLLQGRAVGRLLRRVFRPDGSSSIIHATGASSGIRRQCAGNPKPQPRVGRLRPLGGAANHRAVHRGQRWCVAAPVVPAASNQGRSQTPVSP